MLVRIRPSSTSQIVVVGQLGSFSTLIEGVMATFGYLGLEPESLGGDLENDPPFLLTTRIIIKAFGFHLDFATWSLTNSMNRKSFSTP